MKAQLSVSLLLICFILNAQIPTPDHVVIVIFENRQFSDIIGYSGAPYMNSLANDPYGALFTQSFALTHPSQPNYLDLFSGSEQGVTDDSKPTSLPFTTSNLGASILAKGKTFIGYAEDMPSAGYTGTSSGAYVRKHCPWINWQGSGVNCIAGSLSQPYSNFPTDYTKLPTVSFVVPNMNNDIHDGTRETGDTWLKNNMDAYVQWAKSNNSLLIVTFDEDDYDVNNHITTIFIGQMVKQGHYSEVINHHNVLRTIEDMYGLPYAGKSANVSAITDVWITSPLPMTLINFEANSKDDEVELRWTTATEINNDFFTVENSYDGYNFKPLATVKGAGTSLRRNDYSFIDKNPYDGKSYYRLKQTDYDGQHSYSNVISISISLINTPAVSVYPNPSNGFFTMLVRNFNSKVLSMSLVDPFGKILYAQTVSSIEKRELVLSYENSNSLQPGIYFVRMSGEGINFSEKIIIR